MDWKSKAGAKMRLSEMIEPWIIKKIFWKALSPFMKLVLKIHGVNSRKVKVFGYPRISNEGKIILSEGVELHSTNAYYVTSGFVPNCLLKTYHGAEINIGKNVQLNGTTIISAKKVVIGDNTLLGSNCIIMDTNIHPTDPFFRREVVSKHTSSKEIIIGKNVWLGVNVIIMKGVHIGDNSIIGAGSVLTCDVAKNSIFAGNPAKLVKQIK